MCVRGMMPSWRSRVEALISWVLPPASYTTFSRRSEPTARILVTLRMIGTLPLSTRSAIFIPLATYGHVEHASGHERARHDAAGPPAGVEPRGDGNARFEQVPGKQEEQGAVARKDDRGVLVGGERAAGAQQDVGPARAHDAGSVQPGKGTGRSMPPGATMMCEAASSSALPFMVHETLCGSSPQTVVPG